MVTPPPSSGQIDVASWPSIRGWAADPLRPDARVLLELWHGDRMVRRFAADQLRPDLVLAGIGDGRHGFDMPLSPSLFDTPSVELRVRRAGSHAELNSSPFTLCCRPALDRSLLAKVEAAIGVMLRYADTAGSLAALRTLLLTQFDAVQQRRSDQVTLPSHIPDGLHGLAARLAAFDPLHLAAAEAPEVSVIIVADAPFGDLHRCLARIVHDLPFVSLEVIVVDTGVVADIALAGLLLSGGIRLLRIDPAANRAAALAAASAEARGVFLMLLDSGADPAFGWLDELHGTFTRDPAIGIAGAVLLAPDGVLFAAGGVSGTWQFRGAGSEAHQPDYCRLTETGFVSTAALLVRKASFEAVGGLSADLLPSGLADAHLCEQVRQAGHRVVVQPKSRVTLPASPLPSVPHALAGAPDRARRAFLAQPRMDSIPQPRALIIDDTTPKPDHDAGSSAVLGHIQSLQRLGYDVHFVPAVDMLRVGPYTDALERAGVCCYVRPAYRSAEEVFRRADAAFDLVVLHRVGNATRYLPIARARFPSARLLFSVVDLHFLRAQRQSELTHDEALRRQCTATRRLELAAAAAADGVIVYSSHEATLLRAALPGVAVSVVPWGIVPRARPIPSFADRRGIAFVGGYAHAPNADAAAWLVRDIMPLVWASAPDIELLLVGSAMPHAVRDLAGPGVRAMGHVPDLGALLDGVRLTVAPLRYGAGLKGKVLSSLAAGVPCVGTPCAFEGMELPKLLQTANAATAEALVARVIEVYADKSLHARLSAAGLAFIEAGFSADRVDAALGQAVCTRAAASSHPSVTARSGSLA